MRCLLVALSTDLVPAAPGPWSGFCAPHTFLQSWLPSLPCRSTVLQNFLRLILCLSHVVSTILGTALGECGHCWILTSWSRTHAEALHSAATLCLALYWFAKAALTKYHKLHGLHNRTLLFHDSGGQKSKVKMSAGLRSRTLSFSLSQNGGNDLLQAALQAPGSLKPSRLADDCLFPVFSQWLPLVGVCLCVQISPFYKDTVILN